MNGNPLIWVLVAVVLVFLLLGELGRAPLSTGKPPPKMNNDGNPLTSPRGLPTGSNLQGNAFAQAALNLPGVGQAYKVLAPVNDRVIQPLVNKFNSSKPLRALNNAIGGDPTIKKNPDGTIVRTAPGGFYSDNIGKPISHAVSGAINTVAGWF